MSGFIRTRLSILLSYMYGFDTNTEAKLLNITVDSVRKDALDLEEN